MNATAIGRGSVGALFCLAALCPLASGGSDTLNRIKEQKLSEMLQKGLEPSGVY